MIQRGYRDFVADLRDCELMDSTFMGTLAGVALRLREIGQGGLRAVNVNERNTDLLSNLGLDQIFTVEGPGSATRAAPAELREAPAVQPGGEEQKQTVLEAHEALVEADSANESKFRDVLDFLRQELNVSTSESEV